MTGRLSRGLVLGSLLVGAAPAGAAEQRRIEVGGPREDPVDALNNVDRDIIKMQGDLDVVAHGYAEPLPRGSVGRVERRLREGEIHFLLNDYLRASIVLLDVVDDPSSKSSPRYDESVYLLAESLRRTDNFS